MSSERVCVYTVLLGGYEALNEQPLAGRSSLPFICLTDDAALASRSWDCRVVDRPFAMDPVRSQRDIKIRPHRYLPEYDSSIYIDNSVILDSPAEALWARHDRQAGFTVAQHSGRSTVLDEFVAVIQLALDDAARVAEQLDHLLLAMPAALEQRPWWTGILLRGHHRPDVVNLAEAWAAHVCRYSRRDQLSLNGVLLQQGFTPAILPIDNQRSAFHHWPVRVAARNRRRAPIAPPIGLPHAARLRLLEMREAEVARVQETIVWRGARALRWLGQAARRRMEAVVRLAPDRLRRQLRDAPVIGPHVQRAEMIRRYRRAHLVSPRLDPPVTFNEHIVARILYDRDPRLKVLCDKLAVRGFIADRVGHHFTVPVIGVWADAKAIDWNRLPACFALKPNHASGPIALVGGGADRDLASLVAKATAWLATDYFDVSLEWGYRGIPRRLLAEPLLQAPGGGPPLEIHVFAFGGRAALLRVMEGGKFIPARRDRWLSVDGTPLALRLRQPPSAATLDASLIADAVAIAEALAEGFVHLRVDMMVTGAGLLVNELTPYSMAGNAQWQPRSWDERLGQLWTKAAAGQAGNLELRPGDRLADAGFGPGGRTRRDDA